MPTLSSKPAESQPEITNVKVTSPPVGRVGLDFYICGSIEEPETRGTPESPVVVKKGANQTVTIPFCGQSTPEKDTAWFIKLNSIGENNQPDMKIRTTKSSSGAILGEVSKGITASFDKDFVNVPAVQRSTPPQLMVDGNTVPINFIMVVNITGDAEVGKHGFLVFLSRPDNIVGGSLEIGKPVYVDVRE